MRVLISGGDPVTSAGAGNSTSLRARALAVYEADLWRSRELERSRYREEAARQRLELPRLVRDVLGHPVPAEAVVESLHDLPEEPFELRVVTEGLAFRARDDGSSAYVLEVLLGCPTCGDDSWHAVKTLGDLGMRIRQVERRSLADDCPTCQSMKTIQDNPFSDQ